MNTKSSLKIKKLHVLKGKALKRRLGDLKKEGRTDVTERAFAKHLKKDSRVTIAQWKAGRNWPSRIEEYEIERVLHLPWGFFTMIEAGLSYDKALHSPGNQVVRIVNSEGGESTIGIDNYPPEQGESPGLLSSSVPTDALIVSADDAPGELE